MATVYTSIVEQNVDVTVSKRDVGESPFDRIRLPHVGRDRLAGDPNFVGDLTRCCLTGVENHDLCARRSEGNRHCSTNAAAAAGHDSNLTFKQKIRKGEHVRFLSRLVSKSTSCRVLPAPPFS